MSWNRFIIWIICVLMLAGLVSFINNARKESRKRNDLTNCGISAPSYMRKEADGTYSSFASHVDDFKVEVSACMKAKGYSGF